MAKKLITLVVDDAGTRPESIVEQLLTIMDDDPYLYGVVTDICYPDGYGGQGHLSEGWKNAPTPSENSGASRNLWRIKT